MRLHEVLEAPDESEAQIDPGVESPMRAASGFEVQMSGVEVCSGGRTLLEDVEFSVESGSHIAVVGRSGAGKSTLVGLLLGWYTAGRGRLQIDGRGVDSGSLVRIRQRTAWVDPEVRLWNRELLGNLCYGVREPRCVADVIRKCGLFPVLEDRILGLQTPLGEGGMLVSGGEGQRIRLARAMLREDVRMVILDEAFRGLHRSERQRLLAEARKTWAEATLFFVTHDITESLEFDRVVVLDRGRIVQDGSPEKLIADSDGAFSRMLQAQRQADREVWKGPDWRRICLDEGAFREKANVG
jgi:ABC-type multidrug transport system fused ATPase/permease subunit